MFQLTTISALDHPTNRPFIIASPLSFPRRIPPWLSRNEDTRSSRAPGVRPERLIEFSLVSPHATEGGREGRVLLKFFTDDARRQYFRGATGDILNPEEGDQNKSALPRLLSRMRERERDFAQGERGADDRRARGYS